MIEIYLESARLILRSFSVADDSLIVELDSDPAVMKYLTDGKPTSEDEARATIKRIMDLYQKYNNKLGVWVALEKVSGKCVGWYHLRPDKNDPDNVKDLELGYRLKKDYWNKGYATEMSLELIKRAFTDFDADTVFATTLQDNTKSIAVMKKLGMKFQSSFIEKRFPGKNKSAVKYQIQRMKWQSQQS